jgi:hypothetical protein
VLRYVAGPLQQMTDGRLDAAILRQLLIALAMIVIMLLRPRGLWPPRARQEPGAKGMSAMQGVEAMTDTARNRAQGRGHLQALRRPAGLSDVGMTIRAARSTA